MERVKPVGLLKNKPYIGHDGQYDLKDMIKEFVEESSPLFYHIATSYESFMLKLMEQIPKADIDQDIDANIKHNDQQLEKYLQQYFQQEEKKNEVEQQEQQGEQKVPSYSNISHPHLFSDGKFILHYFFKPAFIKKFGILLLNQKIDFLFREGETMEHTSFFNHIKFINALLSHVGFKY